MLFVCLSISHNTSSPDSGHSISAKYFKLCKTVLSVLLFARYTLQTLKIQHFELASWSRLSATPRYLATCTTWDDGFSVPRVHYTVCTCEMMVCSYPQRSTCIATWHVGYVFYRGLVTKFLTTLVISFQDHSKMGTRVEDFSKFRHLEYIYTW